MQKPLLMAFVLSTLSFGCDESPSMSPETLPDASLPDATPMGDASATPDAAVQPDASPMPGECSPPAAGGTFHSFSAATFEDNTITTSMCDYRGNVVMVVNVAALCGYTPQYEALQDLQDRYGASGFSVLGFLSDDFRMQAGSKDEIEECATRFGLTFPQFDIIGVLPDSSRGQHPLFRWITSQEGLEGDISWNFNKFLVNGDGDLLARWNQNVTPDDAEIISSIELALGL